MSSVTAVPALAWSDQARRELPVLARERRLILDYFATRCCGSNVSIGDLHFRWSASAHIADEFLALDGPAGVEVYVQRDLVPFLADAGGRVTMRGWAAFRRPVIELRDGAAWLDFIGTCRRRSPLSH